MYYVYIIKSALNGKYYIGCSAELHERLKQHNQGKTKSTKPYRPWRMIYYEEFQDKGLAFKREWLLKHPRGYLEKREIIKKYGEVA